MGFCFTQITNLHHRTINDFLETWNRVCDHECLDWVSFVIRTSRLGWVLQERRYLHAESFGIFLLYFTSNGVVIQAVTHKANILVYRNLQGMSTLSDWQSQEACTLGNHRNCLSIIHHSGLIWRDRSLSIGCVHVDRSKYFRAIL